MKLLSLNTGGVHAYHRSDYAMCWNKGQLLGQKPTLKLKEIWAIRIRLQLDHRSRELTLSNLAIDRKLRGCDLVDLRVHDVVQGSPVAPRAIVMQKKTERQTRCAGGMDRRCASEIGAVSASERLSESPHLSTRQYSRIVGSWVGSIGLDPAAYGTHSLATHQSHADLPTHQKSPSGSATTRAHAID